LSLQGCGRKPRTGQKRSIDTCKMQKVLKVYRRFPGDRTNFRYSLVPSAIRVGQICRATFNRRSRRCWRSYSGSIEDHQHKAQSTQEMCDE
jgi:hypothetical protein